MVSIILFILLLTLLFIGVPVGYSVGLATLAILAFFSDVPVSMITQQAFTALDSYPLLAVPFFILSGMLMTAGGVSKRLLNLASALVGAITGGLGMVAALTSVFFGSISGSAIATTSAIGTFLLPRMKEEKYDEGFSSALLASAGTIGLMIPPSIAFVIYGVATNTSVGQLFIAGIIPGILVGASLMVVTFLVSKKHNYKGVDRFEGFLEVARQAWLAKWALVSPIIILGGIYGGVFTPTEAAAVSVIYSLIIGMFVYRELTFEKIYKSIYDAGVVSAITLFLIGFATTFATFLNLEQIPQKLTEALLSISTNALIVLLLLNIFILIIGAFIDNIPAVLILAPILLPVVTEFGITPVHFGVILTLNLAIGFVTPPYGLNLFAVSAISGISLQRIVKNMIPFYITLIVVLLLVTYIPILSLGLVETFN